MTKDGLLQVALTARARAYAPYSRFAVGAALLSSDGRTFTGCNVENVSFGLTMCAERVAVGSALAGGANSFEMVAIVSDSDQPVMPCGACRQVLAEFSPTLTVVSSTLKGHTVESALNTLLPMPQQGILDSST